MVNVKSRPTPSALAHGAAGLMVFIVLVVSLADAKLYQQTDPPPPTGLFGLPTWSVIAAIVCLGGAGLVFFAWAPSRRLVIAIPFIVMLVAVTGFVTKQSLENLGPNPCYELNGVNVGNLQSFGLVDGGSDGSQWISILTDGVADPVPADRMAIVRAVDMSTTSSVQLTRSMPSSLQPVVANLISVAGSPTATEAERSSVRVSADVRKLTTYAFQVCGDAG